MLPSADTKVVLLSAILKKARVEAGSAKVGLDALLAAAELASKERNVALAKMPDEWQDEAKAWKGMTWRSEANLAKVC